MARDMMTEDSASLYANQLLPDVIDGGSELKYVIFILGT